MADGFGWSKCVHFLCDLQPGSVKSNCIQYLFSSLVANLEQSSALTSKPKRLPPLSLYFLRPPGRAYGKGSVIVYGFGPCLDNSSLIQEELPWTAGYRKSRFSLQLRPEGFVPFFGVAGGVGGGDDGETLSAEQHDGGARPAWQLPLKGS